jgi:Putative DNA-binding domain
MLTLAEFQRRVIAELLDPASAATVYAGCESGLMTQALEVHRRTVRRVWKNALQLNFPALLCLISEEDFEALAFEYARAHLPQDASLEDFGAFFPEFLADHPGGQRTRYLIDLARFELALERVAHAPRDVYSRTVPFGTNMHLRLLGSLNVLRFGYPVDLIRDAVDASRSDPLTDLDLTPRTRYFALWRGAGGATVKAISAASAHFLEGVLGDAAAENAIESAAAAARIPASEVIEAIRAEVFTATFLQIIHQPLTEI